VAFDSPSPPYYTPLLQGGTDLISDVWYNFLDQQRRTLDTSSQALATVSTSTTQNAAIATTPLLTTTAAGLYRVTWYLRITQAAGVSSSVTVTIAWTESAVALSYSGAAVTGNTTTTTQSDTKLIRADGATPITYATAYASNPASVMTYRLDLIVERVA